MKQLSFSRLFILSAILFTLFSCSSKTEEFDAGPPTTDYLPLVKGKYITYRIDSLVFTNFGRNVEIHRYQVKHIIDDTIRDNTGRLSYRIYRYTRDSTGTSDWQPTGSYFITPLSDRVELVEDNLRFIKLHVPLIEGYNWKGNKYLPSDAYEPFGYAFSNDNSMKNWDFTYDAIGSTLSYQGKTYNDVTTVEEEDYTDNVPITPNLYANRTRSVESYSKGIGLVYRDYQLWEYQPNPNGTPFYIGFGVTMWMIDHN
jgi:hypothetical protein